VPERRASRFALEVLFLVALMVALTLADLRPLFVVGGMFLGWLIVALLEWAAWRGEPHYGSGLPPRYYVPQVSLPPRQPLEQVAAGYPAAEQRDEAPTWIASPALRAEVLGAWPHAAPAGEDTQEDAGEDVEARAEAEPESVPEAGEGEKPDPWLVTELPAEPEQDDDEREEVEPRPLVDLVATAQRSATHRIDPLAEPAARRRPWRRKAEENGAVAEVPARPTGPRVLPRRSTRED
jgi:hypothetical protein